jgi:hypothetical protein
MRTEASSQQQQHGSQSTPTEAGSVVMNSSDDGDLVTCVGAVAT